MKKVVIAGIGEIGEANIAFDIKNSGMPMYTIHDLHIEYDDLSAQIDYIVVTRKVIFVIECKNLIGDIKIDSNDKFIRSYEFFGKKLKGGYIHPLHRTRDVWKY